MRPRIVPRWRGQGVEVFIAGAIIRHAPDRLLITPKYFGSIEGRLNQHET
jgi:hypothetical protein